MRVTHPGNNYLWPHIVSWQYLQYQYGNLMPPACSPSEGEDKENPGCAPGPCLHYRGIHPLALTAGKGMPRSSRCARSRLIFSGFASPSQFASKHSLQIIAWYFSTCRPWYRPCSKGNSLRQRIHFSTVSPPPCRFSIRPPHPPYSPATHLPQNCRPNRQAASRRPCSP